MPLAFLLAPTSHFIIPFFSGWLFLDKLKNGWRNNFHSLLILHYQKLRITRIYNLFSNNNLG